MHESTGLGPRKGITMRRAVWALLLWTWLCGFPGAGAVGADDPADEAAPRPAPVLLDITDREPPSDEEWNELHDITSRGLLGDGGLGDFSSKFIRVNGTRYWTTNATEGTLAAYGKKITDKPQHFDRMGHIRGVEYSIDDNCWQAKYVVNSDALLKLTGNRFLEYAGVAPDVAAAGRKQIEITFLVVDLPKEQIIRQLNADAEALEYFDGLLSRLQQHRKLGLKKAFEKEPPTPQVVVGNVVVLSGKFSKAWDLAANAALQDVVTTTGVKLAVAGQKNETVTYLSPVVRCYRMFSVDFKVDDQGHLVRREVRDEQGRKKLLPQVFDLTPEN